jgi:VPDSG-CTERM motif
MRIPISRLLWTLIGLALTVPARGNTIVFSTLGPSDSFDTTAAWAIEAVDLPFFIAAQFTARATGNLAMVDLGMRFSQSFGPGIFNAYLYNDADGAPNSADPIFLGSGGSFFGTYNTLVSLPVAGAVPVTKGSSYWLSLQPAFVNAWSFWDFSLPLVLGTVDFSSNGTTWHPAGTPAEMPAFRLTATSSVPDSGSTVAMLAGSFVMLLGLRRYARRLGN